MNGRVDRYVGADQGARADRDCPHVSRELAEGKTAAYQDKNQESSLPPQSTRPLPS
jgi:hypothetical protein